VRDRLKLALAFDAGAMRADLLRLAGGDWIDHFVKQNYDGDWSVLPLRASASARHPIATIYSDPSAGDFADTPLLDRCPYLRQVLAAFECPLQAVRLMKLSPGSVIKPHRDHDLAAEYGKARLHIPVATNPAVEFWLNGERVVLQEGECWYLDLSQVHSVANRGAADRTHLVVDAVMNPWLEERLAEAERSAVAVTADPAPAPPAAHGSLDDFRAAVWRDASLQRALAGVEDRSTFIALALRVASRSGFATTVEEIERAMRETRQRVREVR
jgi:hypothetical protein